MSTQLVLGIDATNLRRGGGLTHLVELLAHSNPPAHGFAKVVVWSNRTTLNLLPKRQWLIPRNLPAHECGFLRRSLWQRFELPKHVVAEGCQVLFVPGGSHGGAFHPTVTMSRNLLPFQTVEFLRYGFSLTTLRLFLLRWTQSKSFKNADGIIFLMDYAASQVQKVTGCLRGQVKIIPHGVSTRFLQSPRLQYPICDYSPSRPYRLLYVSIVDQYKHQWHLVKAVGLLRLKTGWPLFLDLVGPAYRPAWLRLRAAMTAWDPHGEWITYHGAIPYAGLVDLYRRADLGLFCSSCENMPNILLETMAAGLPIAASSYPPMSTLLGDAGLTFNPLSPVDIAATLESLIANPCMRADLARKSFLLSQEYSWSVCAEQTFSFLSEVYEQWSDRRVACAV